MAVARVVVRVVAVRVVETEAAERAAAARVAAARAVARAVVGTAARADRGVKMEEDSAVAAMLVAADWEVARARGTSHRPT